MLIENGLIPVGYVNIFDLGFCEHLLFRWYIFLIQTLKFRRNSQ